MIELFGIISVEFDNLNHMEFKIYINGTFLEFMLETLSILEYMDWIQKRKSQ